MQYANRLPSSVGRQIRRRLLPGGLAPRHVRRFGLAYEVLHQLARTRFERAAPGVLAKRNALFERNAARLVKRAKNVEAVIAQYTCAEQSFVAAARGTRLILMYPIAHHDWMHDYFAHEAAQNPDWSDFLQGFNPLPERKRQLDAEIMMADRILVPSTFVKFTFMERGISADRIDVVPLGTTFEDMASTKPYETSIPRDVEAPLRLLFAGQVNQRKGISYLLDAVSAMPSGSVDLSLAGPLAPGIRSRIEALPQIKILGTMPKSGLGDLYRASDLLVLPSLADGFGLVAIEAMACGLPCVLTPNTFGTDVVTDGTDGFIVPARNSEALVQLFRKVAENREMLKSVAQNASRRALEFTWEAYAKTTSDLIAVGQSANPSRQGRGDKSGN
jgi:glycosyltransferase involved in cell wall biosynthesis